MGTRLREALHRHDRLRFQASDRGKNVPFACRNLEPTPRLRCSRFLGASRSSAEGHGQARNDLARDASWKRAWAWEGSKASGNDSWVSCGRWSYSVDCESVSASPLDSGPEQSVVESFACGLHEQGLSIEGEIHLGELVSRLRIGR